MRLYLVFVDTLEVTFRNCKGISSKGDNVSGDTNEYLNIYLNAFNSRNIQEN